MKNLNDFLESPVYTALLKQLQAHDATLHFIDNDSIYGFYLMDSFKHLHFTLHGYQGDVPNEQQAIQWFVELLQQEEAAILAYIHLRMEFNKTLEDDADGEFAKGEELDAGDRSEIVEILGYAPSAPADFMIEYFLLQYHDNLLADYFKKKRIPGPVKFARQLKKQYAVLQTQ